jgi:WD40 repeat protein
MLNLEWKETEQKTSFRPGYAHENSVKTQENIKYESEKSKNLQPGINVIKEVTGLYGHDEQITCITWSHNGKLLVMGSTDSTCSLWDKKEFKILTAFNCHEGGVTCTRFTSDDCILVTCGGFLSPEIKLWDVSEWVFGNINSMEILHDNRSKWNEALILNTSMKNTMSITIFDDLLPPIHVNHESIFDNCRKLQNKKELVLKLSQIPPTSKGDVEAKMDIHQEKDQCITSRVTAKESDDTGILSKDISPEFLPKNEENNYQKSKKSTNEDETEYSKMEVFDFEDFFDPTSILEKYPTEEVKYRLLDTNRYFIQKCSDYNTVRMVISVF